MKMYSKKAGEHPQTAAKALSLLNKGPHGDMQILSADVFGSQYL